uniref:MBL fold metallo-hydrolase n=1 Tax=Bursaphelenchus xylophilus TaxID=6326 RepID=A0A1I7SJ66_BURXY
MAAPTPLGHPLFFPGPAILVNVHERPELITFEGVVAVYPRRHWSLPTSTGDT